jgi:hypothetical protein
VYAWSTSQFSLFVVLGPWSSVVCDNLRYLSLYTALCNTANSTPPLCIVACTTTSCRCQAPVHGSEGLHLYRLQLNDLFDQLRTHMLQMARLTLAPRSNTRGCVSHHATVSGLYVPAPSLPLTRFSGRDRVACRKSPNACRHNQCSSKPVQACTVQKHAFYHTAIQTSRRGNQEAS